MPKKAGDLTHEVIEHAGMERRQLAHHVTAVEYADRTLDLSRLNCRDEHAAYTDLLSGGRQFAELAGLRSLECVLDRDLVVVHEQTFDGEVNVGKGSAEERDATLQTFAPVGLPVRLDRAGRLNGRVQHVRVGVDCVDHLELSLIQYLFEVASEKRLVQVRRIH